MQHVIGDGLCKNFLEISSIYKERYEEVVFLDVILRIMMSIFLIWGFQIFDVSKISCGLSKLFFFLRLRKGTCSEIYLIFFIELPLSLRQTGRGEKLFPTISDIQAFYNPLGGCGIILRLEHIRPDLSGRPRDCVFLVTWTALSASKIHVAFIILPLIFLVAVCCIFFESTFRFLQHL